MLDLSTLCNIIKKSSFSASLKMTFIWTMSLELIASMKMVQDVATYMYAIIMHYDLKYLKNGLNSKQ